MSFVEILSEPVSPSLASLPQRLLRLAGWLAGGNQVSSRSFRIAAARARVRARRVVTNGIRQPRHLPWRSSSSPPPSVHCHSNFKGLTHNTPLLANSIHTALPPPRPLQVSSSHQTSPRTDGSVSSAYVPLPSFPCCNLLPPAPPLLPSAPPLLPPPPPLPLPPRRPTHRCVSVRADS